MTDAALERQLTICACGKHWYHWALRSWVETRPHEQAIVDGGLPCMKGRGNEAVASIPIRAELSP